MAMTDQERVKRYQSKCDAIMLRPKKELGAAIRAAAAKDGASVQAWIIDKLLPHLNENTESPSE